LAFDNHERGEDQMHRGYGQIRLIEQTIRLGKPEKYKIHQNMVYYQKCPKIEYRNEAYGWSDLGFIIVTFYDFLAGHLDLCYKKI